MEIYNKYIREISARVLAAPGARAAPPGTAAPVAGCRVRASLRVVCMIDCQAIARITVKLHCRYIGTALTVADGRHAHAGHIMAAVWQWSKRADAAPRNASMR